MSDRKRKGKCMAIEWKNGVRVYLPEIVISGDLRRVADDVYFNRTAKLGSPLGEPEWNPSWSEDEEEWPKKNDNIGTKEALSDKEKKFRYNGDKVQDKLQNRVSSQISTSPEKLVGSESFRRKFYNKKELFKNWGGTQSKERKEDLDRNNSDDSSISHDKVTLAGNNLGNQCKISQALDKSNDLVCKECGKVFSKKIHLTLHAKIHSRMDKSCLKPRTVQPKYTCPNCKRQFDGNEDLVIHMEEAHPVSQKTRNRNPSPVQELACEKCDRHFQTTNQLKFHRKLCKHISKNIFVGVGEKEEVTQDPDESRTTFKSDYDDRNNSDIRSRDRVLPSAKKFTCTECGKEYKLRIQFNVHKCSHRHSVKNSNVALNDTEFDTPVTRPSLNSAASSIHEAATGSWKCCTCGKTFANLNSLNEHKLLNNYSIVTFEEGDSKYAKYLPFICWHTGCESRFSDKSDLNFHLMKKHNVDTRGVSNPTYYYIQDEQIPPLNPYVLITYEVKKPAEELLRKRIANRVVSSSSTPRLLKQQRQLSRRGRQVRTDIPFQNFYICETCDKKFYKRNYFLIHIAIHKREEKFTCKICHRKFQSESLYNAHVKLHSDPNYEPLGRRLRTDIPFQSVYTCEKCGEKFYKRNLYLLHLREEKFTCKICERKFQSESIYNAHVKLHSDPNYVSHLGRRMRADIPLQSVYTCETCGEKFDKRNLFLLHLREEKFKCHLCDHRFQSEVLLEAHVKRHADPSYVPTTGRGRGRFRYDIPIQSIYKCDTCGKQIKERNLFLIHISTHKREEKFRCKICDMKHVSSTALQFHMKRHSDPSYIPRRRGRHFRSDIPIQSKYTCEKCEIQFEERRRFIIHISQHEREERFRCKICHMKNASAYALQHHMKRHSDPSYRPRHPRSSIPIQDVYTCESCQASFTDRQKYICHLYYHRNSGNDKLTARGTRGRRMRRSDIPIQDVYYCEQCGYSKSFTDRIKYIIHLRNHSLEKCHKCNGCLKQFKTATARDIHQEKFCKRVPCKYKCDRCKDMFHNKITLARHFEKYHSKSLTSVVAEVEYPCNQCSQTFNTTFGLTRHQQIYHPVTEVTLEHDVPKFAHDYDEGDNSSQPWSPDGGSQVLAASFCEAELTENPEAHDGQTKQLSLTPPREGKLCQCGLNKKYKSQKFCHSLRCPCVQAGNRCSKNCDCDNSCLNSNEMEDQQLQKFKEGKESMMLENDANDGEENASTPVVIGYSTFGENDDNYAAGIEPEPFTSSSSFGYGKLIPTSEIITLDDEQDESMRQLSLEGYVEGVDDADPLADSFQESQILEPVQSLGKGSPKLSVNPPMVRASSTVGITDSTPKVLNAPQTIVSPASIMTHRRRTGHEDVNDFNQSANLHCQFCKKSFKIIPTYISHILLHEVGNSSLLCPICLKNFDSQIIAYIKHLDVHNKGINLQCTKCSSKFKAYGDMDKHLQVHHFRPMECGICAIKFSNSQLMMSHWSKVHPTCQCGLCNVKYFSYDDLTFHMKSLHSPYDCLRCNERFENLEGLSNHFIQQHSATGPSHSLNQSSIPQNRFQCSHCNEGFPNGDELNEHLSNHLSSHGAHGKNQYPTHHHHHECDQCKASFTTAEDLHDHLAHHIMGNDQSFAYSNVTNVNNHVKYSAPSNNEVEAQSFNDDVVNDNIQAVEVLTCPKCGKGFHHRHAWRAHLASHKVLLCSACDSSFDKKEELLNHLKINSCVVHFCEVCDRNFQAKKYLTQHTKFVHGEKKSKVTTVNTSTVNTPMRIMEGALTTQATGTGGNFQFTVGGNSYPLIMGNSSFTQNLAAYISNGSTHPSLLIRHVQTQNAREQQEIEEIVLE